MRSFSPSRLHDLLQREEQTFWRHDVDCSLNAAYEMAKLEAAIGVSARYYLMADSPFYEAREALVFAEILHAMGHDTGYHVDPRHVDPSNFEHLPERVNVSFHCPRPEDLWTRYPGINSAYDPIWEGHYYADSRGRFAHGDPEDRPGETIQVNLHPEWWFLEKGWWREIDDALYERFFHEPKRLLAQP